MDSLLLVVARARPDVFESLCRQCTGLEGLRVVMDRRERDGVLRPAGDRRSRAVAADLAALGFAVVPAGGPARPRAGGSAPATIAILRTLEIFRAFSGPEIETLASRMTWRAVGPARRCSARATAGRDVLRALRPARHLQGRRGERRQGAHTHGARRVLR